MASPKTTQDLDEAIADSFPASDPPAFDGATASPESRGSVPTPATDAGPTVSPLMLRLTLAAVFFPHGAQKALGVFGGPGLRGTIDMFQDVFDVPAVLAVLVIAAEFLGPIAPALGLLTRFTAFALGLVMAGAIYLAHAQHGFFMNWSGEKAGEGFEFHLLAIGSALALLFSGAGRWSLDAVLRRRWASRRAAA